MPQGGIFFRRVDVDRDERIVDGDILDVFLIRVLDLARVRSCGSAKESFEEFATQHYRVAVLSLVFRHHGPFPALGGCFEALAQ